MAICPTGILLGPTIVEHWDRQVVDVAITYLEQPCDDIILEKPLIADDWLVIHRAPQD
jgi:hypothetical protein